MEEGERQSIWHRSCANPSLILVHLRSYLAPLQITPTRVGASPSLLVLSIWKWINFSFGQTTVALNRPPRLQRGLSLHRLSSPETPFIEHTPSRVCGLSAQESSPSSLASTWQCASVSSSCLPLLMWLYGKSWSSTPFQQTTPVEVELVVIALPVVRDCRPQVRKWTEFYQIGVPATLFSLQ